VRRPPRRSERPARPERRPARDDLTLEDLERPAGSFDEIPAQRPSRRLEIGGAPAARMVGIVAPLGYGQRALIAGPPGSGATALLREVGRGIAGTGARVQAVLVDVRPEEVPEWAGVDVAAAHASSSPREQVALAERVLDEAKQAAARGEDAVVLLDSLTRLGRAYALSEQGRAAAVEATKRWFAAARDAGPGRGSLTLIAIARVEDDSSFDALVHDALADSANMVVRLDAALAARGHHPAIDASRSRTLGEEALLDPERRRLLENMRGVARSLDPEEAWRFLAERARENS
jgi:transcription termination factor Rho